jgi:hypothetical protein
VLVALADLGRGELEVLPGADQRPGPRVPDRVSARLARMERQLQVRVQRGALPHVDDPDLDVERLLDGHEVERQHGADLLFSRPARLEHREQREHGRNRGDDDEHDRRDDLRVGGRDGEDGVHGENRVRTDPDGCDRNGADPTPPVPAWEPMDSDPAGPGRTRGAGS